MRHRLVTAILILAGALGAAVAVAARDDRPAAAPPVSVYQDLDGIWAGTFIGYDTTGKELYRIQVRQEYETVNDTTQRVRIRDTMPDGTVITGEGENTAERLADGTTRLRCVVRKSNGERVTHDGRIVTGPDGDKQLVWFSTTRDRVETFRESVRTENGRDIYEINGMGRYGDMLMLMHGRYVRQPAPTTP